LFLDSLDEALLEIRPLATGLARELGRFDPGRLSVRIACRTAEWPRILEEKLVEHWGRDSVGIYELLPLTERDVREAAIADNISADDFLAEVERQNAVALAIKPITLDFLLTTFKLGGGRFPINQSELYLEGCRYLCEESSPSRIASRRKGVLTASQRLSIASRIAAVTIFSNRSAVWISPEQPDRPSTDVAIRELAGGRCLVGGDQFEVTEDGVWEALGTGLFSARGPSRLGWVHQTYAEFLAAWAMCQNDLSLGQIRSLLVHPSDPESKLVPQLRQTAGWLASMRAEVFDLFMRLDPGALLASDLATKSDEACRELTAELLSHAEREEIDIDSGTERTRLAGLNHSELADQLRPHIADSSHNAVCRMAAIEIAAACKVSALGEELADLALDSTDASRVRLRAALAVGSIRDNTSVARLLPLAAEPQPEDTYDELKGAALLALWPEQLTGEALFGALTIPKRDDFYGLYQGFLMAVARSVRPEDIVPGLRWLKQVRDEGYVDRLGDSLLRKALGRMDDSEVRGLFADVALDRFERHENLFQSGLGAAEYPEELESPQIRRSVVGALVDRLSEREEVSAVLRHSLVGLLALEDAEWAVQQLEAPQASANSQELWAYVIWRLFLADRDGLLSLVYESSQRNAVLAKVCGPLLDPVVLDSPEAKRQKEEYYELKKLEQREVAVDRRGVPVQREDIERLLERFETGDADAWWQLTYSLALSADGRTVNEHEPDLRNCPGWELLDERLRGRVLRAAQQYLHLRGADVEKWLGKNIFYRPAAAGLKALRLLQIEVPKELESLPPEIWEEWVPILLAYRVYGSQDELRPYHELVAFAYRAASESTTAAIEAVLEVEDREGIEPQVLERIALCWDDRLDQFFVAKLRDQVLSVSSVRAILSELIERGVPDAREIAEGYFLPRLPRSSRGREMAQVAVRVLLLHAPDAGWPAVGSLIRRAPKFARELFLKLTDDPRPSLGRYSERLREHELGELYECLARLFPSDKDPPNTGGGWVTPREKVAWWRDGILQQLQNRGTREAVAVLEGIAANHTADSAFPAIVREAKETARYSTWSRSSVPAILKLLGQKGTRLVESGSQLLDVLVESLLRLQAEIQGELPSAQELWDRVKRGMFRPKEEQVLSDKIARHFQRDLEQKGVIAGREVQIRRRQGGTKGQSTDIYVEAVRVQPGSAEFDSVSAIVEVKGCWHPEVETAIEDQLVARYLDSSHRCCHGLYVVGWYVCDAWEEVHRKKRMSGKPDSMQELKRILEGKAADLTTGEREVRAFVLDATL
jgi:hypothetical protein